MREALGIVLEEGLETRWARHQLHGEAVRAGIKAMGLGIFTEPGYELPVLTAVRLREGIDELAIRNALLDEYNIEIGGGVGALKGDLIRIGFMWYNLFPENIINVVFTVGKSLHHHRFPHHHFAAP